MGGELSALRYDISNATKLKDDASAEVIRLTGLEAVAGDEYRKLAGIQAKKKGIYEDFLAQNKPQEKDLLELGSSEKGKAYLKLIANVQANPGKLEKIIGFVGTLWAKANSTLADLKHKVDTSLDISEAAEDAALVGKGKWAVAVKDLENAQTALAEAEGSLEGAIDSLKKREPVIKSEVTTLREVINLLKSTADKPQPTVVPQPTD